MDPAFTVSEVNSYIKQRMNADVFLSRIYIKGEISGCKYHNSGHIYFTLKDSSAQISCIIFAGKVPGISFKLENGQSVIALGRISVYEAGGTYGLYVDEIKLDGIGKLYEEYEALKKKLEAEGLFDSSLKKPVPRFPRTVGIVTAPDGAAIRDICQISKRRNPYVKLILYPAKVQGLGASDTIVKGIKALEGKCDVMIVGRGGGSIEDLWAFNEEKTVRAIFNCKTPVISAVGHETDTTLSDFVSDLRAPTPSAAAELAVFDLSLFEGTLSLYHERLTGAMLSVVDEKRNSLKTCELKLKNKSPEHVLSLKKQRAEAIRLRLANLMKIKTSEARKAAFEDKAKIRDLFYRLLNDRKQRLSEYSGKIVGLNPAKKLESGFSYVSDKKGKNLTSVKNVKAGDHIDIVMTDGRLGCEVKTIEQGE